MVVVLVIAFGDRGELTVGGFVWFRTNFYEIRVLIFFVFSILSAFLFCCWQMQTDKLLGPSHAEEGEKNNIRVRRAEEGQSLTHTVPYRYR